MIHREIPGAELTAHLLELGVTPGGVLLVHSSFSRVGPVEGGPGGLILALQAALGPTGTLVMPSMSDDDDHPFDRRTTPCLGMGVVAETFWRMPGVLRSDSPHAFAAIGPHAARITADHPIDVPHGLNSPVGRVYELDGQILMLGVGHDANTTVHLAEALEGCGTTARNSPRSCKAGRPCAAVTTRSIIAATGSISSTSGSRQRRHNAAAAWVTVKPVSLVPEMSWRRSAPSPSERNRFPPRAWGGQRVRRGAGEHRAPTCNCDGWPRMPAAQLTNGADAPPVTCDRTAAGRGSSKSVRPHRTRNTWPGIRVRHARESRIMTRASMAAHRRCRHLHRRHRCGRAV